MKPPKFGNTQGKVIVMTRGTTPTHTFKLPFNSSMVKEAMVIYAQNDVEVFCKYTHDCTMEGNSISVTLDQEETLLFSHHSNVQIQLKVKTTEDVVLVSVPAVISVQKCLNDEVL